MSEPMEDLSKALAINQVPGRNPFHKTSWEARRWPHASIRAQEQWWCAAGAGVAVTEVAGLLVQRYAAARRAGARLPCAPLLLGEFGVRSGQLERWSKELVLPFCLWLPGLFNPVGWRRRVRVHV